MNRQFQTLLQLLSDVEPSVYQHLSQREANDVLFAYRYSTAHWLASVA
jgi:hypothetical protein